MMATERREDVVGGLPHPEQTPTDKPCRACTDFRSWMKSQRRAGPVTLGKAETSSTEAPPPENSSGSSSERQENSGLESGSVLAGRANDGSSQTSTVPEETDVPLWGQAAKYGCPADSLSLGRGSWRLLHSMAAYYPTQPTPQQQNDMKTFITIFSKFYPCQPCAEDFREWLKTNSPAVDSRSTLSRWFCEAHNEVNRKLEKPLFNCDLIDQRWGDGWKDGSCD
ncbi:mitochondrial FAD-linked sulfhydryl oxidase erv1-like [Homarus americanus]|uniref:FAD-linked sulfhydryl oxidase ALR n=1 Tax=Homarus americanus TaxID=6706 RepID=A0A8J5JI82_HOMAM|nr:mitochondrial FAD-linked sulfhydryl oxidase erv1-like [Homarus americanus]XP_042203689.1 mitochondrial FAD-linked sulfhydryl oxidase erv1-like [Homarus americanus]KAG7156558.1 FAD-linked sulfhydryl oxidase ALR-like [Homarus americanus]